VASWSLQYTTSFIVHYFFTVPKPLGDVPPIMSIIIMDIPPKNMEPLSNYKISINILGRDKGKALPLQRTTECLHVTPPWSLALSKQSLYFRELNYREIVQALPSKEDIVSMLAKLEASFQGKLSALSMDIHHLGHQVGDLEEDR
ncbi:Hypothetical predicted protein, partial [Pelobates cultripes]